MVSGKWLLDFIERLKASAYSISFI